MSPINTAEEKCIVALNSILKKIQEQIQGINSNIIFLQGVPGLGQLQLIENINTDKQNGNIFFSEDINGLYFPENKDFPEKNNIQQYNTLVLNTDFDLSHMESMERKTIIFIGDYHKHMKKPSKNIINLNTTLKAHALSIACLEEERLFDSLLSQYAYTLGTILFFLRHQWHIYLQKIIEFILSNVMIDRLNEPHKDLLLNIRENLKIYSYVFLMFLEVIIKIQLKLLEAPGKKSKFYYELRKISSCIPGSKLMVLRAEYLKTFNTARNLQKPLMEKTMVAMCIYIKNHMK